MVVQEHLPSRRAIRRSRSKGLGDVGAKDTDGYGIGGGDDTNGGGI